MSFPAVGTYRREMQISPSFSGCQMGQGAENQSLPRALYRSAGTWSQLRSPQIPLRHNPAPHTRGFDHWGGGQASPSTAPRFLQTSFLLQKGFCTREKGGRILPGTHTRHRGGATQRCPGSRAHPTAGATPHLDLVGPPLTSSFSPLCRSRHSSMGCPRSTVFMGTFTSPMMSCLEKRSKS